MAALTEQHTERTIDGSTFRSTALFDQRREGKILKRTIFPTIGDPSITKSRWEKG